MPTFRSRSAFASPALVLTAGLAVVGAAAVAAESGRPDLSVDDLARVAAVTAPATVFDAAEPFELMAGGAATSTRTPDTNAFSHPSANLGFEGQQQFAVGNGLFRKVWVSAPSSTQASDGLGPLYNARSCQRCHLKDGRGRPPTPDNPSALGLLLRLSIPPRTDAERNALVAGEGLVTPEPTYGTQLQTLAVPGLPAEGRIEVRYETHDVALSGGETVTLSRPVYTIADLGYGPLDAATMVSPRLAQPMIGLGLLEAIHPADILAAADPEDADRDGISGRVHMVRDAATGEAVLGRFGWKATAPSVKAQSADAFNGDIGISTPLRRSAAGECTEAQTDCRTMPTGVQDHLGDVEAPDPVLDLVATYARNLAVPARRAVDEPEVLAGKAAFYRAGCIACHTPKFVTRRDAERPEHRFQLIWPYTDMLLHDMGEGLADDRPDGAATGREWRTPPLWGIGLTEMVNDNAFYLHDGRARTLLEAILWHGGEAEAARARVVAMPPAERDALLAFLRSL